DLGLLAIGLGRDLRAGQINVGHDEIEERFGGSQIPVSVRHVALEDYRIAFFETLRRLLTGSNFNLSANDDQAFERTRRMRLGILRMARRNGQFVEFDKPFTVMRKQGAGGEAPIL